MTQTRKIAVIGGTGQLGAALAGRLAKAGHDVVIGSRSQPASDGDIPIRSNADAAQMAEIVILAVPFAAQESTLTEIAPHVTNKIVVDTTVPLVPPKVMRVQLPPEGSAAVRTQNLLGEDVRVVSGFHNVAAYKLAQDIEVECDVLVFSDDREARRIVAGLAQDMGLRGIEAGALANSAAAEAMTSILIFLNKTYKVDGAGLKITGDLTFPED
jgi:8-hydroxy-5-deazaflavin:NADPH oxidoreductase